MNKVFISFHRADSRQKDRLVCSLKENNIDYYVVPEDDGFNGVHNQEICKRILTELDKCNCVICLVGKETYQRPHVDHEIKYALHRRKGIVSLFIENRRDSIFNPNLATYPARLKDNKEYVVESQFGSGLGDISKLIDEAVNISKSKVTIDNSRKCMALKNKIYYEN